MRYIPIPTIVDVQAFEKVQALLANRNPRVTPPRAVNGPCVLIGLATCADCGAGMTRTGTTRRGHRSSYYSCGGHHQKGETACPGHHISTEKLDGLVLTALKDRLLPPERLSTMLSSLLERRAASDENVERRVAGLRAEADEAEQKLKRLYALVEDGGTQVDHVLRQRLQMLQADKGKADAAVQRATKEARPTATTDGDMIKRFGDLMRDKLDAGDVNARRSYIASVVNTIEVGPAAIRISGRKTHWKIRSAIRPDMFPVFYADGAPRRKAPKQQKQGFKLPKPCLVLH